MSQKAVFKYPLHLSDHSTITMPKGAQILSVAVQRGIPCLWATVDVDAESEERRFEVRGTGQPLDGSEGKFLGTVMNDDQSLVFHIFELIF